MAKNLLLLLVAVSYQTVALVDGRWELSASNRLGFLNCTQVCWQRNLMCDESGFLNVTTCDDFYREVVPDVWPPPGGRPLPFNCDEIETGPFNPAFVTWNNNLFVSTDISTCDGTIPDLDQLQLYRFCPCEPRPPTNSPTQTPTMIPTKNPTLSPTVSHPTIQPTYQPTSSHPTSLPTSKPTPQPTFLPSVSPSQTPSTFLPSGSPSQTPSIVARSDASNKEEGGIGGTTIIIITIVVAVLVALVAVVLYFRCYKCSNKSSGIVEAKIAANENIVAMTDAQNFLVAASSNEHTRDVRNGPYYETNLNDQKNSSMPGREYAGLSGSQMVYATNRDSTANTASYSSLNENHIVYTSGGGTVSNMWQSGEYTSLSGPHTAYGASQASNASYAIPFASPSSKQSTSTYPAIDNFGYVASSDDRNRNAPVYAIPIEGGAGGNGVYNALYAAPNPTVPGRTADDLSLA